MEIRREQVPAFEQAGPAVIVAKRAIALQLALRVVREEAREAPRMSSVELGALTVRAMTAYVAYVSVPQEFARFGMSDEYAEGERFEDLLEWLAANPGQWDAMEERLSIDRVSNLPPRPEHWV